MASKHLMNKSFFIAQRKNVHIFQNPPDSSSYIKTTCKVTMIFYRCFEEIVRLWKSLQAASLKKFLRSFAGVVAKIIDYWTHLHGIKAFDEQIIFYSSKEECAHIPKPSWLFFLYKNNLQSYNDLLVGVSKNLQNSKKWCRCCKIIEPKHYMALHGITWYYMALHGYYIKHVINKSLFYSSKEESAKRIVLRPKLYSQLGKIKIVYMLLPEKWNGVKWCLSQHSDISTAFCYGRVCTEFLVLSYGRHRLGKDPRKF